MTLAITNVRFKLIHGQINLIKFIESNKLDNVYMASLRFIGPHP